MAKDYSVFVNAAAVVLLPGKPVDSTTNDLMNSVLLAQLVANKRTEATRTIDWYDTYVGVLGDFWLTSVRSRQDIHLKKNDIASPLEWVVAVLASDIEAQQVMRLLEVVARLPDSLPGMSLLRKHVLKESDSELADIPSQPRPVRLLVIVEQDNGSMSSVCLQFKTRQMLEINPWGQRFHAEDMEGYVSAHFFHAHLSETLYAPVRAAIAGKVEGKLSDTIADITEAISTSAVLPIEEGGS
ncbi:hypothetical protein ABH909_000080 [Pseudomonas sp. BS3782 TE3695]|uniref:hypothetical protein n=1 Tax=Pseudomonas sp. BS3782 TE3695 TaxID=3349323 RepID=UPI003D24D2C9